MATETAPDKLSVLIYDHHFDKVHYALVMASAAAAIGKPTTVFFTMGAAQAIMKPASDGTPAWADMPLSDQSGTGLACNIAYGNKGVATFDELLNACQAFGVTFMVCEMGLRAKDLMNSSLRDDLNIEVSGIVTFMNDASKDGAMVFI